MTDKERKDILRAYAKQYETEKFLQGDPSWFMHHVEGRENQEAMAFLASCLSYGSRKQFMPKIQWLLERSGGRVDKWIRNGSFENDLSCSNHECYYRLYTCRQMNLLLRSYRQMLDSYGTMGEYIAKESTDGITAIEALTRHFNSSSDNSGIIPKDTKSACKRICMFLRWMVRGDSPVDLGLWADFIDRRTLVMPLDTHVLQQSVRLGLLSSRTATMSTAVRLTKALAEVFPDDPLKGDFALFGYGVNQD
ncbi:MAG: TIGR02757 family protein [Prevotella sp.]|nr:TIGR02757 family protein [Prevotella sp.]